MQVERWTGRVLDGPLEDVYVYEAPVRIWHWVNALSITLLAITGYLIANPPPSPSSLSSSISWVRSPLRLWVRVVLQAFGVNDRENQTQFDSSN